LTRRIAAKRATIIIGRQTIYQRTACCRCDSVCTKRRPYACWRWELPNVAHLFPYVSGQSHRIIGACSSLWNYILPGNIISVCRVARHVRRHHFQRHGSIHNSTAPLKCPLYSKIKYTASAVAELNHHRRVVYTSLARNILKTKRQRFVSNIVQWPVGTRHASLCWIALLSGVQLAIAAGGCVRRQNHLRARRIVAQPVGLALICGVGRRRRVQTGFIIPAARPHLSRINCKHALVVTTPRAAILVGWHAIL